jgi:hypothetical protein
MEQHAACLPACLLTVSVGMTAGDSVGPVAGAVMFDATGIRGAFTLQAAINCFALVVSALMIPLWLLSPQQSRDQLLQAQPLSSTLPTHGQPHLQRSSKSSLESKASDCSAAASAEQHGSSTDSVSACKDVAVGREQHQKAKAADAAATETADTSSSLAATEQADHDTATQHNKSTDTRLASDSSCTTSSKAKSDHQVDRQQAVVLQPQPQQQQQQQQPLPRLDLAAVLSTMKDPIIFSQCLLLLLEQAVRSSLTIVLPAAMGMRQLVVGMVYLANVSRVDAVHLAMLRSSSVTMCCK